MNVLTTWVLSKNITTHYGKKNTCNFTYGDIEDLMYGGRSKVCPLVKQFLHPDVVAREKWLSQLGSGGK